VQLIYEKNQRSKISWYCLLNRSIPTHPNPHYWPNCFCAYLSRAYFNYSCNIQPIVLFLSILLSCVLSDLILLSSVLVFTELILQILYWIYEIGTRSHVFILLDLHATIVLWNIYYLFLMGNLVVSWFVWL
jgi:hypothetical protein